MKSIRKFADQPLTWTQIRAMTRQYELRSGDGLVATLEWPRMFSSWARGKSVDGEWTFERDGWPCQITVSSFGSGAEIGVLKLGWGEGTLVCANGSCYHWKRPSFWRGEWAFTDEKDQTLVQFTFEFDFFKFRAATKISPAAIVIPELPLLALLGCYTMILKADDAATASAASVAVTCS